MSTGIAGMTNADIIAGQREFLLPAMLHMYSEPLPLAEGQGVRVRDADGKEYLDLFSGILTTSVGHCHPRIIERVTEQMQRLGHVSTLYATEMQVEAARRLADIAPGNLKRTFFTNSGTEAIETALMMACLHTGRSEIIALRMAYHGRSFMATSVTAHACVAAAGHAGGGHPPHAGALPVPVPLQDSRATSRAPRRSPGTSRRSSPRPPTGSPRRSSPRRSWAWAGYVVPPPGYFQRVAEIIRGYGGLLIIDEVQAGFGRTGKHWFGIEHHGVEPDIMVMAKGIAGGFPVGATITTDEIASSWKGKTISTFGGNPICMAAMCATLEVMARGGRSGAVRGARRSARDGPARRCSRSIPGSVTSGAWGSCRPWRSWWTRWARSPTPSAPTRFWRRAATKGCSWVRAACGATCVRIGPSLLVTEDEIAEGLEKLGRACAAVEA